MRIIAALIIALLLIPGVAWAQVTVAGRVVDGASDEPLVGANIVVIGTTEGTITDVEGRFSLAVTSRRPFTLRISYIGYDAEERTLERGEPSLEVALEPRILVQGAVVVSASRRTEKLTAAPASVSVLYAKDLETQTLTNPVESLRNVAGVDVTEQGVNNYTVTLRGRNLAFDTATYFMIDNRQATTPGLAVTIFGRQPLNPDDIERIEVVRGPGSALYGPGVDAGVVHFITKNPFDHPGTNVSVGGGGQSSLKFAGTHRGLLSDRLGYKITALYSRATNWAYDPQDPDDADLLGLLPDKIYSGVDGSLYAEIDGIDPETHSAGVAGALEYRLAGGGTVSGDIGYTTYKGINRFTLGEIYNDFPEFYGQIRLRTGRLFAQAYAINARNDERSFLYRTGTTLALNSAQYEIQVQHGAEVPAIRTSLTYGGELQHVTTDTKGTVNGMFEDDDSASIFGGYLQSQTELSPRLALTLAGRVDRFDRIEYTVLSPRAGLVFQAAQGHSVRLSLNRAFASPTSLSLYTDLAVADLSQLDPGLFGDVRLLGGASLVTFDEAPETVGLIPGMGSWAGVGLPLPLAYEMALGALDGAVPGPVFDLLRSHAGDISGFTPGVLFDIDKGILSEPRERTYRLKPRQTDMVEVGYTGIFNRLYMSVSAYYAHKKEFESDIRLFGPLVVPIQAAIDLQNAVDEVVSDAELAAVGIDREALHAYLAPVGAQLAETPAGLLQPDQVPVGDRPQLVGTFVNFGAIDYIGLEAAATWFASDRLSVSGTLTRLSQIEFDDVDLGVPGTGERYGLNVPRLSYGLKADYVAGAEGLRLSASFRHKGGFNGNFGEFFEGRINEQNLVDASAGWAFQGGLTLNVTGQNLFDSRYRSFVGLPKIGRLVLVSARYAF